MSKCVVFADRFSQLCRESGLSYAEIAEQIGVKRARIYDWEDGTTEPVVPSVIRICRFFHVSADWLLGLTNERG